jgi:hypothetical protein
LRQRFHLDRNFIQKEAEFAAGITTNPDSANDADARAAAGFFRDYEVIHFRLRARYKNSVYGFGVAEAARWIWRRLILLEDATMIFKLTRAPAKYAFYVDVGDLAPKQAEAHMNRIRQKFKKHRFVNPSTGQLDFRWNPLSSQDDFWIPVRQGRRASEVEVLSGPDYQNTDALDYFRSKLFAALKVPKLFMNYDENTTGRTTLSAEDVRFARTVLRLQRELRNGFKRTGRVHLSATGIDPASADFEVHMTAPSSIFELAQIEVQNARADLGTRLLEVVSRQWVLQNVFGLNDGEIKEIFTQRVEEAVLQGQPDLMLQKQQAQEQLDAAATKAQEAWNFDQRQLAPTNVLRSPQYVKSRALTAQRERNGLERFLTEGRNKEAEKRADDKLNKLLQNDKAFARRLDETRVFLHELKASLRSLRRAD